MLKTLTKQSKKRIIAKDKIHNFIKKQLWQHLIVVAFVCFCAWILNKPFQAIMFCISHYVIRMNFDKQYHCRHSKRSVAVLLCLITTLSVAFFGIMSCLPLNISLISVVPVCYLICWIGYIVQDRIDCKEMIKDLTTKNIWQMEEAELRNYCYSKGIRNEMIDFVVMIVVYGMKFPDISKKLGYAVDTLKDWSPKCKLKLGIDDWKPNAHQTHTEFD